jgi:HEPN domain-containing protein
MEDVDAAIRLEGNIYTATHAQQAAEKLGRALLTAENSHVNTRQVGHRLDVQFDLIADENPFKARLSAHSYLEAYATTFRYPTPSGKMNRLDEKAAERVKSSVDVVIWVYDADYRPESMIHLRYASGRGTVSAKGFGRGGLQGT